MINLTPPHVYPSEIINTASKAEILAKKYLNIDLNQELFVYELTGGLTKSTYHFTFEGQRYVLKFLDKNRALSKILKEMWISQHASEMSIGPRIIHFDLEERAILMHFAEGSPLALEDPSQIKPALEKLRLLHETLEYEPFDSISRRGKILLQKQMESTEHLVKALKIVEEIERIIKRESGLVALCHNDLHNGNILVDQDGSHLIDWGSAGFGSPYYDLVKLTFKMDFIESLHYLKLYLDREPTEKEEALFFLTRCLCFMTIATNRYLKSEQAAENLKTADEMTRRFLEATSTEAFNAYKRKLGGL